MTGSVVAKGLRLITLSAWLSAAALAASLGVVPAGASRVSQLTLQADREFERGQYKKAAQLYTRAAGLDPANDRIRDLQGRSYARMAESSSFPGLLTRRARASYRRAIELNPKNSQAIQDLLELSINPAGTCYGDFHEAGSLAARLTELRGEQGTDASRQLREAIRDSHTPEIGLRCLYRPILSLGLQSPRAFETNSR